MNISRILNYVLYGLIVVIALFFAYEFFYVSSLVENENVEVTQEKCKPTFADGGGPYYKPDSPFREKIVPEQNEGQKLVVKGKVLKNDCKTPVVNAILDIWQANETGNYQDTWYRGKVTSDQSGNYQFETVVPKGYGEGTGYRPPHIHFKVFLNNREIITSQMFLPGVEGRPGFDNEYIMSVEKKGTAFYGSHNIILP